MPSIEDVLTDIHLEMKRRNLQDMDDETILELSRRVNHPEVMRAFQSGQLTASKVVDEVQEAVRASAEGGLVNDSSGQATARIRQQYGLQPQSLNLGPMGGGLVRNPVGTMARPGPFGNQMNPLLDPSRLGTVPGGYKVFPRVPGGRLPTNQLLRT